MQKMSEKWSNKKRSKYFFPKSSYRWTLQNQDGHFQLSIFSCGQISVWSWCCCHTPKRIIAGVVPVQEISPDHLSSVRLGCLLLRKIVIIWFVFKAQHIMHFKKELNENIILSLFCIPTYIAICVHKPYLKPKVSLIALRFTELIFQPQPHDLLSMQTLFRSTPKIWVFLLTILFLFLDSNLSIYHFLLPSADRL